MQKGAKSCREWTKASGGKRLLHIECKLRVLIAWPPTLKRSQVHLSTITPQSGGGGGNGINSSKQASHVAFY